MVTISPSANVNALAEIDTNQNKEARPTPKNLNCFILIVFSPITTSLNNEHFTNLPKNQLNIQIAHKQGKKSLKKKTANK